MGKLDGKVALITGAGSGIGRASALLFAKEGAKVAVVDYVPEGGRETVKMIKKAGGEAIFIEADVSKAADAERMVKTTVDTYGRIDILFNNAGIMGPLARTAKTTEEQWDLVVNINLKGVFLGSKYAIPVMLNQGGGVIVNTGSTAGIGALPRLPAYSASKAGVIQLSKAMAMEYGGRNIRVNCICPGGIQTPIAAASGLTGEQTVLPGQPIRRVGQPEDIAHAVLYLASDDASYVTGATLIVDGGYTSGRVMFMEDFLKEASRSSSP
jgi:NAD(P)-dependent dehydrogenase (short-subunit alcohol dehydrogenase family)